MPIREVQRRDSWPPTQVRMSPSQPSSTPILTLTPPNHTSPHQILPSVDDEDLDINTNPIQFFLTTPPEDHDNDDDDDDDDEDDYYLSDSDSDEDLSAGIETPESASTSPIREISPSSLQRNSLIPLLSRGLGDGDGDDEDESAILDIDDEEEEEAYHYGIAIPLTLSDFTDAHAKSAAKSGRTSRASNREPLGLGISGLPNLDIAARGRPRVRLFPQQRGRGRARSLSSSYRRPLSWRAPGQGIFPIAEEDEERDCHGWDTDGDEKGEGEYSMSAPASTRVGSGEGFGGRDGGERKGIMVAGRKGERVKKRVHWAF